MLESDLWHDTNKITRTQTHTHIARPTNETVIAFAYAAFMSVFLVTYSDATMLPMSAMALLALLHARALCAYE